MDDIYTNKPSDNKLNYPFSGLKFLVDTFKHFTIYSSFTLPNKSSVTVPKVFDPTNKRT